MNSAQPVKIGILLAAFGSASPLGEAALAAFAAKIRLSFPGVSVRWAYTSGQMRNRLAAVGKKTDSVKKALCRMGFERYTHVAVQSLHLIHGLEYENLLEETKEAAREGGPKHIAVGLPLLHEPADVIKAAQALLDHLPKERKPGEPVVCMGHGTWHSGAASYQALAEHVGAQDSKIFIGTLSGAHTIEYLLPDIVRAASAQSSVPQKVWLLPLLSIIGRHAERDMAGEKGSWRSRLESCGLHCRPVLTGTVEYEGFARIWAEHLAQAVSNLPAAPTDHSEPNPA